MRYLLVMLTFLIATPVTAQIDFTARATAARASAVASPVALRSIGNIGLRVFGGQTYNPQTVSTSGRTWEVLAGLAAPFDAVRIILAVGNTDAADAITPKLYLSVAAPADTTDATVNAATPKQVLFSASNNPSLPPAATNKRRAYLISDWVQLSSVARTDDGKLPLIAIRAWVYAPSTTGNIIVSGDGTTSFANWATHPSGRLWRTRGQPGDGRGNWATGFSSPTTQTGAPIVGIQYLSRGKVVNVAGFGDSITEGRGSTYVGEGFGMPAAVALSNNPAGVAFEWSDFAWSGQTMSNFLTNLNDVLAAGLTPDIAVLPSGSPNSIATTIPTTGAGSPDDQRWTLAQMLIALAAKKIEPIVWTWMPTNTYWKAYASTDALRRTYNADTRARASLGMVVADFDGAMAGVDDGTGQIQIKVGLTTDLIHPNDSGNAILSPILQRAIRQVVSPAPVTIAK